MPSQHSHISISIVGLLVCLLSCACIGGKEVRIVPGVDKFDPKDPNILEYVAPKPYWGPLAATVLSGSCFHFAKERNEFTVCPFQNVTTKRVGASRATLVGTWDSWVLPEDAPTDPDSGPPAAAAVSVEAVGSPAPVAAGGKRLLTNSSYTGGVRCGGKGNTKGATVQFVCIDGNSVSDSDVAAPTPQPGDFGVISVDDSQLCTFGFRFAFPLPCALLMFAEPSHSEDAAEVPAEDGAGAGAASTVAATGGGSTDMDTGAGAGTGIGSGTAAASASDASAPVQDTGAAGSAEGTASSAAESMATEFVNSGSDGAAAASATATAASVASSDVTNALLAELRLLRKQVDAVQEQQSALAAAVREDAALRARTAKARRRRRRLGGGGYPHYGGDEDEVGGGGGGYGYDYGYAGGGGGYGGGGYGEEYGEDGNMLSAD